MNAIPPEFETRIARDEEDLIAAQHLRYRVFVEELGGSSEFVDHDARLERDRFDPFFDHLLLLDTTREGGVREQVVGVYRLMPDDLLPQIGSFYSESEYDLTLLRSSGRKLLELGRSCLHPDYRGGQGMYHLWRALAAYVLERGIEILFGTASFHGTDVEELAQPLSLLHERFLAPEDLRVTPLPEAFQSMDLVPAGQLDRPGAMKAMPALIKGYLRLGGFVGDGAYVDREFNTTDVCMILDTRYLNEKQTRIYTQGVTRG